MLKYLRIAEGFYNPDEGAYLGYGIAAVQGEETIVSISDISTNVDSMDLLIAKCNELQLDPIHLPDIVEDYIVGD